MFDNLAINEYNLPLLLNKDKMHLTNVLYSTLTQTQSVVCD